MNRFALSCSVSVSLTNGDYEKLYALFDESDCKTLSHFVRDKIIREYIKEHGKEEDNGCGK